LKSRHLPLDALFTGAGGKPVAGTESRLLFQFACQKGICRLIFASLPDASDMNPMGSHLPFLPFDSGL